ncbi:putative membrane protein YeaQ/YmgE (transglycosylase-associated protein family) [Kushneria sinocarnis]|uniref:Putative membrane protein YeaQ/YmgE (Transglycosylase-associated protein family) n=1 Tax=Kushneria sinocarnis TaxID=595502 RepID=A0A420WWX7_9GAMM|nr:GlsB/YeaQ/YmgE family stress response membrane protein [Kushneria sinocarnis]RKR04230.1 putative membrane protein YeaQ/YmgE (transglycosylase-associated protein family) [Kushneria sinocarnis]
MGIIAWIIFGLIAGAIAKFLMPGKDPGGIIVTIIIGIVGALLGGWIGTALGFGGVSGFNFGSFVIAILGAIILLFLYRVVRR